MVGNVRLGATTPTDEDDGWITRKRAVAAGLTIATIATFYVCYRLVVPFLAPLAWALALAVISLPMHRRISAWVSSANIAAGLSVAIVSLTVVLPVLFVSNHLVQEAGRVVATVQERLSSGEWRQRIEAHPRLRPVVQWVMSQITENETPTTEWDSANSKPDDSKGSAHAKEAVRRQAAEADLEEDRSGSDHDQKSADEMKMDAVAKDRAISIVGQGIGAAAAAIGWLGAQLFITMMCLYFFLRDRREALQVLRSLLPLSSRESNEVFKKVDDTVHATVFGALVVALIQGSMGGLMFWVLKLPSPLLWGAIMGLLAVVPVLGTFVIWAPTAAYLALQGEWGRAAILAAWGAFAIGLIDNFIGPYLIGQRIRFHTLLVFIAIVGGLAEFGASGIILGPVALAIADALIDVWKRRTAFGGALEDGVAKASA
jgi:predicted PurR-regulated permease PerM